MTDFPTDAIVPDTHVRLQDGVWHIDDRAAPDARPSHAGRRVRYRRGGIRHAGEPARRGTDAALQRAARLRHAGQCAGGGCRTAGTLLRAQYPAVLRRCGAVSERLAAPGCAGANDAQYVGPRDRKRFRFLFGTGDVQDAGYVAVPAACAPRSMAPDCAPAPRCALPTRLSPRAGSCSTGARRNTSNSTAAPGSAPARCVHGWAARGEVTDKGSVNHAAVLANRAQLVAALYEDSVPGVLIVNAANAATA